MMSEIIPGGGTRDLLTMKNSSTSGARKMIDRELPKPSEGFQDRFKDGKVHNKLRASHLDLLSHSLYYVLWFLVDECDSTEAVQRVP